MTAILVMWLWPFDYHYFIHPKLDSYEMFYHLALLYFFGENANNVFNSSDLGEGHYDLHL